MTIDYHLILTVVNSGYAEAVMQAARRAGARGGTIISARGTKAQGEADFLGIPIQPEKDIVLILSAAQTCSAIMSEIATGAGLNTEGRGFSFALPATDVTGVLNLIDEKDA
ncbi:MAG: P-II family nitrogen regulator [Oscillospiraceae bacterium]|jgi:hypothetical protein|nr:P-II family nitrogen regulator [Oscillospiraceae bacterium]